MNRPIATALTTFLTASASAGPLLLEGSGMTYEIRTDLPGGDSFPFTGLMPEVDVPFSFSVLFDSSTPATSNNGTTAVYHFSGTGSWMDIGGNLFEPTLLTVTTSTSASSSWLSFSLRHDTLGVTANLFFSTNQPGSLDLPTSLSLYGSDGEMTANSDQNTFLIPILAGMFDGATITPAPSGWGLLGLGLIVAGRRRR